MAARSLFRRLLFVVLVLGTCVLAEFPAAAGQGAAPDASRMVDLAWVALIPADLPEPGYGQGTSTLFSAADYAEAAALDQDKATIERFSRELQAAGWQRAYRSALLLPSSADTDQPARSIQSFVSQCADEASASRALVLLQTALIDYRGFEPETLPTPITDEAILLRKTSASSPGEPDDQLRLLVRDGPFLIDLLIIDVTDAAPLPAEAITLIGVLQDRIQEVVAGTSPMLSGAVQRLDPEEDSQVTDGYRRRSNQHIAGYQAPSELTATIDARLGGLGVIDLYRYAAVWLEWAQYGVDVLRFASEADAAAQFRTLVAQELAKAGHDLRDVTELGDLPPLGDDFFVVTFTVSGPEQRLPEPVYVAWIRDGDRVAEITLIAYDATASKFEPLAQGQGNCLQTGDCWEGTATLRSNS
jgi:hypothetical protein